ncbi:unnamed protein product [Pedinophyceae sp. YPF-701]|nr:unnamed protein product [Pedinophyceae sp. YPF-701]
MRARTAVADPCIRRATRNGLPAEREAIMPGGPRAGDARFVWEPSDEISLSFKTVRARPRTEGASPAMETLLSVPEDELEELLTVALTRCDEILSRSSKTGGKAFLLTRIDSESTARSSDIEATTTLVPLADVATRCAVWNEFCRSISTPETQYHAQASAVDADGRPFGWQGAEVTAAVQLGGRAVGPVNITPVIREADGPTIGNVFGYKRARKAFRDARKDASGFALMDTVDVGDAGRRRPVQVYGAWSEAEPGVVLLDHDQGLAGDFDLTRNGWRSAVAGGSAARAARETVRALRSTGFLQELCACALVPPAPYGVAAELRGGEQDWDAAGRFPAVTLNILQGDVIPWPRVYLALSDGMRWRPTQRRGRRVRLAAEISDSEAFCRQFPANLSWARCLRTLQRVRVAYQCGGLSLEMCDTLLDQMLRDLLRKYARRMGSPDGLYAAEDEAEHKLDAFRCMGGHSTDSSDDEEIVAGYGDEGSPRDASGGPGGLPSAPGDGAVHVTSGPPTVIEVPVAGPCAGVS